MVTKSDLAPSVPDWFSQFYAPVRKFGERIAEFFSPNSEASTTDDFYEITIELPGVSEVDISVEMDGDRLTISGEKRSNHEESGKNFFFSERAYGKFQRVFRMPPDADDSKVSASHRDGLLTIQVAKVKPTESKVKSIPINKR